MHEQKVTKLDCEDYFFPKLTEMGSIIMATENTFPGVHPLPETSHKKITTTVKKCVMREKVRNSVMHVQKVFLYGLYGYVPL